MSCYDIPTPKTYKQLENLIDIWALDLLDTLPVFKNQSEEINKFFFDTHESTDKIETIHTKLQCMKYFANDLMKNLQEMKEDHKKLCLLLDILENNDKNNSLCDCQIDTSRQFYLDFQNTFCDFYSGYKEFASAYYECTKHDRDISRNIYEGFARAMMKQLQNLEKAEAKMLDLSEDIRRTDSLYLRQGHCRELLRQIEGECGKAKLVQEQKVKKDKAKGKSKTKKK